MHPPSTSLVGIPNSAATVNDSTGRKIRPGQNTQQLLELNFRVVNYGEASVNGLGKIMWWNIGRHTHGNTRRTVHQKIRKTSWQHRRLFLSFVVIGDEVDGLPIEIIE